MRLRELLVALGFLALMAWLIFCAGCSTGRAELQRAERDYELNVQTLQEFRMARLMAPVQDQMAESWRMRAGAALAAWKQAADAGYSTATFQLAFHDALRGLVRAMLGIEEGTELDPDIRADPPRRGADETRC
ncbi:MAG TPA: hypothetical protein VM389_02790 [Phycisphaerae bacterium]|nr:hypothetical protein [Phycisphaerae bacterium]